MAAVWLHLRLAVQGLLRNRVQTVLAMLGVMVGVGALVTSLALGRGAQQALDDQLRAAGANLLVVTAGNYKVKTDTSVDPDAYVGHGFGMNVPELKPDPRQGLILKASFDGTFVVHGADGAASGDPFAPRDAMLMRIHFEDDPMAVHDHPTAAQRLGDASAGLGSAATLTRDDARAIAKIPGVQYVVSGIHENERLFLKDDPKSTQWFTRMHGTEADLPEIRSGWTMVYGHFLTHENVERGEQVAVLGKVAADHLFGKGVNPVGREVVLWHQHFKVVGVVGSRSWVTQPAAGDDQFDAFYVPVSTIDNLLNLSKLNNISVTTVSVGETTRVAKEITDLLRKRHKITEAMADDFTVTSVAQQVLGKGLPPELARVVTGNMRSVDQMTVASLSASLKRTNWTIVSLLAGVAAVSLLVGGIGVMNLLLLSVTQRTREVGLRVALGARHSDIAVQFLLEAVLLCVAGGLLGVVCGVAASGSLEKFFKWSAVVSPVAAATAVAVAVLLGMACGVYPARRAAQLDPIEALKYE
ncbi:ABC transporter permease [Phenylobacterium sp.]|uniref:ABC transporter permease n=1 Tax=Phenylobacterium sp. TaxID=1871053 RepID=UPI0035B27CA9